MTSGLSTNFALDKRPAAGPSRALRVRINLDAIRQSSGNDLATPAPRATKHLQVRINKTTLQFPYYRTRWQNKATRRAYWSYTLVYNDGLKRRREKRSSFEKLEARAEEIAKALINGETARLQLTPADQASYLRARDLAAPTGKPLELLVSEHVQFLQMIGPGYTAQQVAAFFLEHRPRAGARKTIPEIVTDFFVKRKMGEKWRKNLKTILDRFAAKFTGPFTALQSRDLEDWLDSLSSTRGTKTKRLGLESRANYRAAVVNLVNFARSRGYVTRDWDIMSDVSDPAPAPVDVKIYTPEELVALLNFAESYEAGRKLVPLVVTTAFAGVRHGEINEDKARLLDWADYDFEARGIYIAKGAAKTGRDRIVDLPDNLIAWLQPYRRPTGKICLLKNTANALGCLRKKCAAHLLRQAEELEAKAVGAGAQVAQLRELAAGIGSPRKNALRKSFISYQKALTGDIARVADQAGNSPGMIRKNYLLSDTRMRKAAERWFAIFPTRADVLPLFAWGRK